MNILSLYDGMACGHIAMMLEDIPIDRYVAYEIDGYAVKTAVHNFPDIEQRGDVFDGNFTEFEGFDWLIGGSPCTYWSIAQKNNRETEASGLGWELFCQYVRALKEAKPKWFIYENNKSMSKAIRESISDAFGFEPICINSALVSAQNRQRLYWVGRRNVDGTYSKVDVPQPEDRGILLRDVLEGGYAWRDKQGCIDANYFKGGNFTSLQKQSGQRLAVAEPVCPMGRDKSRTLTSGYVACSQRDRCMDIATSGFMGKQSVAEPVNLTKDGKSQTIKAQYQQTSIANICCYTSTYGASGVAETVRIPEYGVEDKSRPISASYAHKGSGEGSLACDAFPDNPNKQVFDYVAEPVNVTVDGFAHTIKASYAKQGMANFITNGGHSATGVAEPVRVGCMPSPDGEIRNSQAFRVYDVEGKSVNLTSGGGGAGGKTGLYAIQIDEPMRCGYATPCEWDEDGKPIKAVSCADGKVYIVYEVKDGKITIKGKEYPIKLVDGFYIIRKLTVRECMRLQTVPEWYEFPVSDTQAYKLLGNGWTIETIRHLIRCVKDGEKND